MTKVPKMSEKEAVKLGASLFAEFCFYAVASGRTSPSVWWVRTNFSLAIALNEVRKYKAREKEIDEAVESETNELLENVVRLDRLVDSQICDIEKLDNIVQIYDKKLRSVE